MQTEASNSPAKSPQDQKKASRRPQRKSGALETKSTGRLTSDPNIDSSLPLKLTLKCRIPKVTDVSDDKIVAYQGDLVLVNCVFHKLDSDFKVDENYAVYVGGELAGLVQDWHEESSEVWARRQCSSDSAQQCSGAVEIFQVSSACTVETHIIGETQCHAYTGFISSSTAWKLPFITSWMSTRRRDADNQNYTWDERADPHMKTLKTAYLASLPCSLARFDIIRTSSTSMQELAFITDTEGAMINTIEDESLHNFELLVLQFIPEDVSPNWRRVNVIFLSNWRLLAAKRMSEGFDAFLSANLWYLERFDFDDTMFTLGANVGVFESLDELRAAEIFHDILVILKFLINIAYMLILFKARWNPWARTGTRPKRARPMYCAVQSEIGDQHVAAPRSR